MGQGKKSQQLISFLFGDGATACVGRTGDVSGTGNEQEPASYTREWSGMMQSKSATGYLPLQTREGLKTTVTVHIITQ